MLLIITGKGRVLVVESSLSWLVCRVALRNVLVCVQARSCRLADCRCLVHLYKQVLHVTEGLLRRFKIVAKTILEHESVFLQLDDESHAVLLEELLGQVCIHVAAVVDMHAISFKLKQLHASEFLSDERIPSCRSDAKVDD